jgi:hypothetical protein
MRRFINTKRQQSLIHSLNREFTRLEESGRFATAIVASYLSHRNRFTICNACDDSDIAEYRILRERQMPIDRPRIKAGPYRRGRMSIIRSLKSRSPPPVISSNA